MWFCCNFWDLSLLFSLSERIVTHCEFPHFHLTTNSYCSSIWFAITAPSNSCHSQLFCLDVPLNLRNKLVRYNYAHEFHSNGEKPNYFGNDQLVFFCLLFSLSFTRSIPFVPPLSVAYCLSRSKSKTLRSY